MKKTIQQSLQLLFIALLMPLSAWADREINQLQFGKQTITVASDEVITFKDPKGAAGYNGTKPENAHSLTVFQPAEAGMSVQITFSKVVMGGSSSYCSFARVYSGDPDADNTFSWMTEYNSVNNNTTLPDGEVLKEYPKTPKNAEYTNETYISNSADGIISMGFVYNYAYDCEWTATVKCVKLENMTITGAGSNYDGVEASPTTKQNVALANAYVTATGVMNPDNVTAIWVKMTQNESAMDPTALKLFKGDTQVSATVAADGDAYKFTLNEAAADGTTTFTIKGDFLGTAAVGAKVQVEITKIATEVHPSGITPFTAASSVTVENPAMVLMTSTPQTVTVGETPMQFYDEGGKDGKIIGTTSGQVTFLSGVSDKKVMVDISKLVVNNGSMYYQVLKFYNGTEVNSSNLIAEKRNGETGIVRSTADDGSLTVVLEGASQTYEYDGWEATVSLFTPQPMDFDGITTAAASDETVAAGDTDQDMLTITVKAVNTEPAMKVTKMAFTSGDNYALATKAALYFGSQKVGETDITATNFTISLTTPQELTEGSNVFTLKYNISNEAMNGDEISARLVSVSAMVNNAEKTENYSSADEGIRTVNNLVLSHLDQGTVTKTVNGSMAFETQKTSSYSSYCEAGTDDRINIFVPKNDGMVCQIDFTEFEVQYSNSSYGTKSTFKIYAGQGTSGELLWELSDNAQQSEGPGKTIRSTAADGSLTIVFNPKSSYSYYYKGFKATVSEYLSKPMAVTGVEVTQASTADASIGASEQELLAVNVQTEGNMDALTMSSMKLNLKGTEANIEKVSIWQDDTKIGEAAAAADVTITFAEAITLAEGDNNFVVKADIKGSATENQTIDAKVVSIQVGAADVAAENGDPEGSRTLKNMLLMTAGGHGTFNLALEQIVKVYDDGGPEGDGANGVEATITFAPTGDADCIKLTNKGIDFGYTAHLYIYKGGEVNDDNLIVDLTGSSAKFDPIISDATIDGGKLTIKYVGKGSSLKPNFAIEAEGYKKSAVAVTAITTEDISVSEVLIGQSDTKMLKIAVEAKGELGSVDITSFNITGTDGEPVNAYHIYQTGTTTTFSANNEFTNKYTITNTGTYYFWLTYDVNTDASVGMTASAQVTSVVVDGTAVNISDPATASFTVASGKHGTYTVGEGGDYATIQAAVDDLGTLGMDGPVTLQIKAGEYNEKVRVPNIMGMGSSNTLTIESESGERDVKIYHNQYTTGGYSDDQHKKDYGVMTLYQASYVTLKNLEIYTTDKAYKAVVMVKDESRHVTIDNCYLHAPICTVTGEDVALVGHTIIDEENKNNDYLTVKNCLLEGGKYGISMGGTNYVALPKEVGGIIEGNTFKNNGTKSIYVMDELGVKIKNNTITIDADAETKISVGVLDLQLRDEYSEPTEITGNIFNVAPKTYAAVIDLRQVEGTADAPLLVANNVINLTSQSISYSPFKLDGKKIKNVNIAYNTIRVTGSESGAAFWVSNKFDDGYGEGINVVNNVIQNETNGYAVNLYNDANIGKINFENNIIYTAGATFWRAGSGNEGDFADFAEKNGATDCVNKQVNFLSDDVLEPADDLDGDLTTAKTLDYVSTDITGKERPAENATIGAYEYDASAQSAPEMAEGYPKVVTALDGNASFSVKTDIAATVYYIVKKAGEDAPTAEELKASETKKDITANTEAIVSIESLEGEEQYVAYFLPVSLRGVEGVTSQTGAFTMAMTPPVTDAPEAMVFINSSEDEETIEAGESVSLFAMVTVDERTAPYTLTWMDSKHNILLEETYASADDIDDLFTVDVTPTECTDYTFIVKDAAEKADTATVRAIVTGDAVTATFENLYLDEESFFMGTKASDSFVSGSYMFDNGCMPEYSFWYNFGYSNKTATTFNSYGVDDFNSIVGSGVDGSENFCVAYPQGGKITVLNNPDGDQLKGCYITNAAVTALSMQNGDAYAKKFTTGDYFKLIITADNGNSVEFYLADFTSENEDDHYIVNTWQWVDLSSLGTVKYLTFSFDSTDKGSWGINTPTYFCLDNFNCEAPENVDTGIGRYNADNTGNTEKRYTLDGRAINGKQRGINIMHKADGTVQKVVVK